MVARIPRKHRNDQISPVVEELVHCVVGLGVLEVEDPLTVVVIIASIIEYVISELNHYA